MDFRPLTRSDSVEWAALLARSFNRSAPDMERLLSWLHDGYEVIVWGAWDGPLLAAQYAVLKVKLAVPALDEPVIAGMSLNMCVHPDYRGRGLIKQVSAPVYHTLRDAGALLGMGFSNAEGVQVDRNSKGYGYRVLGRLLPTMIYFLPRLSRSPQLELTTEWPGLPVLLNDKSLIHLYNDACRIHHRYAAHPFRQYHYAVWRERGELCGVVVYRPAQFGWMRGATLLAAYGCDLPELLRRWEDTMYRQGIAVAHVLTTPSSHLRAALPPLNLRQPYTRSPCYLTAKPLDAVVPESWLDFNIWDCVGGDIL